MRRCLPYVAEVALCYMRERCGCDTRLMEGMWSEEVSVYVAEVSVYVAEVSVYVAEVALYYMKAKCVRDTSLMQVLWSEEVGVCVAEVAWCRMRQRGGCDMSLCGCRKVRRRIPLLERWFFIK